MKIKFQQVIAIPISNLVAGDEFSTKEEPDKLFMKILTVNDIDVGKLNCIDLSSGKPGLVVNNGLVIPKKAIITVE